MLVSVYNSVFRIGNVNAPFANRQLPSADGRTHDQQASVEPLKSSE